MASMGGVRRLVQYHTQLTQQLSPPACLKMVTRWTAAQPSPLQPRSELDQLWGSLPKKAA